MPHQSLPLSLIIPTVHPHTTLTTPGVTTGTSRAHACHAQLLNMRVMANGPGGIACGNCGLTFQTVSRIICRFPRPRREMSHPPWMRLHTPSVDNDIHHHIRVRPVSRLHGICTFVVRPSIRASTQEDGQPGLPVADHGQCSSKTALCPTRPRDMSKLAQPIG